MTAEAGREFVIKSVTTEAGNAFTVTSATDLITVSSNPYTDDDQIVFSEGTAPGGLEEGRIYYVISTASDDFQVSLTEGGSAVTLTADAADSCVIKKVTATTQLAGLKSTSLSIDNTEVDVSTKDDEGFRRLLDGISLKSMSMTGGGIFVNAATKATLLGNALDGTIDHYQLISGHGDRFEGAFQMNSIEVTGENEGVEEFSFTLGSSGGVAYVAAS
jgi:TP901-1 family phage major tail protein